MKIEHLLTEAKRKKPNLGSFFSISLDIESQQTIRNFCVDHGLNPKQDEIQVPLIISNESVLSKTERTDVILHPIVLQDFTVKSGKNGAGDSIVYVTFDSSELYDTRIELIRNYKIKDVDFKWKPYFIISDELTKDDLDFEKLSIDFNEYVPYCYSEELFKEPLDKSYVDKFKLVSKRKKKTN